MTVNTVATHALPVTSKSFKVLKPSSNHIYIYTTCRHINKPLHVAMEKAAFNKKKKTLFYQQIGLKFEEETSKMIHLEHGFVWC